MPYVKADKA